MDDHDNLCPECNGGGYLAYYGPNEGERTELRHAELCYSCHDGVITTIPAEEEAAQSAYQAIGGTLHTEHQNGRDVLTLPWPIRPR